MAKPSKPKKVSYRLIESTSEVGAPMYALLTELVDAHHEELVEARIALAWCTSWKADVDGRLTLGKCKKASDLDRELAAWDFIILLLESFWHDPLATAVQRRALLDHELTHGALKYDARGEPVVDERGRRVYRTRRHDIEEFGSIVERHGCYKRDLEAFASAIDRARQKAESAWVGYASLQQELRDAGLSLSLDVIVTWSDAERREARTWALLRAEQFPQVWLESMPAFLASVARPEDVDGRHSH